ARAGWHRQGGDSGGGQQQDGEGLLHDGGPMLGRVLDRFVQVFAGPCRSSHKDRADGSNGTIAAAQQCRSCSALTRTPGPPASGRLATWRTLRSHRRDSSYDDGSVVDGSRGLISTASKSASV